MSTIIKSASVKVMRSFDYCHFEVAMSVENDSGLSAIEIDSARKVAMRLADKAVEQYKIAKSCAAKRQEGAYYMNNFENECKMIKAKDPNDRTIGEMAKLKQYEDENWRAKFDYSYDYEDDYEVK
jgi:hypothetical protein